MISAQTLNALTVNLYGTNKQLFECQLLGFLTYETGGCFYMSFVLQAFYRLIRVVYTKHKFLRAPQSLRERQRRRVNRDLIVTRRIIFIVIALALPGLPNLGFAIMTNIDHRFSGSYHMYQIEFMGPAVVVFILSIAIIFITPQIKQIISKMKIL
ncbi:unnamed protein product [Rotaria sp. Silwood1]|nr:unnamed protein product [Rotaria sp. Silwood1]